MMRRIGLGLVALAAIGGCGGSPDSSGDATRIIAVAGDIASPENGDEQTAALVAGDPSIGLVLTTGDNAYESGTAEEFAQYYAPSWGAFREKTRPSPGNHDYRTPGAAGYFGYFGSLAGPEGRGYYSFDYGNWHVVSLNSEVESAAQIQWLRADLRSVARSKGILAFWHRPLFNVGLAHGEEPDPMVRALWTELEAAQADLILNGHEHSYQRYRPQDQDGEVPNWGGIREFVVGTGGRSLYPLRAEKDSGFEFGVDDRLGILKLTLTRNAYAWRFVGVDGTVLDEGGPVAVHTGPL